VFGGQIAFNTRLEQQVRQLNQEHPGLANLESLARLLLRAEAVASSQIEGLVLNVRRLARSEAAEREGVPLHDAVATSVLGNIRALDEALAVAADPKRPITVDDVRAIHAALLVGTRDEAWAGRIRTEQNWIGGSSPCVAAFVPPPAEQVLPLLVDLATYLSDDRHPALLQAAVAHAQFETIHPFADGNGRTGRALIQLVLRRRQAAVRVLPPISLVLATAAGDYVRALDGTRTISTSDGWRTWLEQFLAATGRACRDAGRFTADLAALEGRWRAQLGVVRRNSAVDLLVSALPSLPVFSINTAAAVIGRTFPAVNDAVRRMVDAGVITQINLGRRNRAFEVVGLFEAFTGFERALASPEADTPVAPPARPVPARPAGRPAGGSSSVAGLGGYRGGHEPGPSAAGRPHSIP